MSCPFALMRIREFIHTQYRNTPRWPKWRKANEFIPCSSDVYHIIKRFASYHLIWPKTSYNNSITRFHRSGNESGQRLESPLCVIEDIHFSLYLTLMTSNAIRVYISFLYFTFSTNQSTAHGINIHTYSVVIVIFEFIRPPYCFVLTNTWGWFQACTQPMRDVVTK